MAAQLRMTESQENRLVVGISGASGVAYGIAALRMLRALDIETHLVMTNSATVTLAHEVPLKLREAHALASVVYRIDNIGAAIASGSFRTIGMLVAPCSIRSLSEIAYGMTSNLLTRAADVVLKERRRLVLMVRETPLHLGHLRAMAQATEAGAIIMPPVPALYAKPGSIDEVIQHSVGRALDLFGIDAGAVRRWGEQVGPNTLTRPDNGKSGRTVSPSAALRTPDPLADISELDNDLWRFVLPFYSNQDVSRACLVLQEQAGVDVNVLLFAIFARIERSVSLDAQELSEIDGLVRGWRTEIIFVLRQARTRLKSAPYSIPSSATEELRNRIKADEIRAEQIELAMLTAWLDRRPPRQADLLAAPRSIPRLVVCYFAAGKTEAQRTPDLDEALRKLERAVGDLEAGPASRT
jgi:flavin prenyltransferase